MQLIQRPVKPPFQVKLVKELPPLPKCSRRSSFSSIALSNSPKNRYGHQPPFHLHQCLVLKLTIGLAMTFTPSRPPPQMGNSSERPASLASPSAPTFWSLSYPTMSAESIEARAKESERRQARRRKSEACKKEKLLKDEHLKTEAEARAKGKQLRKQKRNSEAVERTRLLRLNKKSEVNDYPVFIIYKVHYPLFVLKGNDGN